MANSLHEALEACFLNRSVDESKTVKHNPIHNADVVIGRTYRMKVSERLTNVRIDRKAENGKGWYGTNLASGREVRIRTAAKLRRVVEL